MWFRKWKNGNLTLEDEDRSGRPKLFSDDELRELVEANPHFTSLEYAEELDVDDSIVRKRLHAIGYISKLNKWVPYNLDEDKKLKRFNLCLDALNKYKEADMERIITCDEKWVRYTNKSRGRTWTLPGEPPAKVPKTTLTANKVLLIVFWDVRGIIHHEYLKSGETLTAYKYSRILSKVNDIWKSRSVPSHIKRKGILFLQDNAKPHIAKLIKNKLKSLNWETINHPPYSPDCSPTDYHLFLSLQNYLDKKKFENSNAIKIDIQNFFNSKSPDFYRAGICKLRERWQRVVDSQGSYFD